MSRTRTMPRRSSKRAVIDQDNKESGSYSNDGNKTVSLPSNEKKKRGIAKTPSNKKKKRGIAKIPKCVSHSDKTVSLPSNKKKKGGIAKTPSNKKKKRGTAKIPKCVSRSDKTVSLPSNKKKKRGIAKTPSNKKKKRGIAKIPKCVSHSETKMEEYSTNDLQVWLTNENLNDSDVNEYIKEAKVQRGFNIEQSLALLYVNEHNIEETLNDIENYSAIPTQWHRDRKLFVHAIRRVGKEFNKIKNTFFPHKSVQELVEYYYLWKMENKKKKLEKK